MWLPLVLVISLVSSPAPALNADEQAIIAATVKFVHLDPFDSTAVLSDRHLPLSELSRTRSAEKPNPLDFTTYAGARHVLISDELIDALRAANRKSVSLRKVMMIPKTKGRYHDSVSRPGISRDGLSALPIVDKWDGRRTRTAATTVKGRSAAPFFRADERLAERDAVPPMHVLRARRRCLRASHQATTERVAANGAPRRARTPCGSGRSTRWGCSRAGPAIVASEMKPLTTRLNNDR
jgi:hypothetical protein